MYLSFNFYISGLGVIRVPTFLGTAGTRGDVMCKELCTTIRQGAEIMTRTYFQENGRDELVWNIFNVSTAIAHVGIEMSQINHYRDQP